MKKMYIFIITIIMPLVLFGCKKQAVLIVDVDEVEINLKETFTIEARVENVEAQLIYTIIEGEDIILLEGNNINSIKAGNAVVRVTVEGYSDTYVDVNIKVLNDDEAPLISFASDKKLSLNWGKAVTKDILMQGVTSTDNIDGDITSKVEVKHEINNRKYGTYEVKYESTDSSGNTTSKTREVEIVWDYSVEFIGHQGCYYGVPNSEEAFLYAADVLQYQALETDVKQTKDGVFVCCHDDTFAGVTIANVTWEQLKDVVATSSRTAGYPSQYGEMPGTGKYSSTICSLERYLEICKEYGIKAVIELKGSNGISNDSQARMPALMELIKSKDMLNQTIFLASAYKCLIWVKQNGYDYIPCQYLVGSCESETYFNRCVTYGLDISVNTTYGDYSNSAEWIARYQDAGLKVSTYTYTQYVDYSFVQKWINMGVDYVTCDWHSMYKLDLPEKSESNYHTVKFYDLNKNLIKEVRVKDGRTAASPMAPTIKGYEFTGWSESIQNVTSDLEVYAEYKLVEYKITYNSNLYTVTKTSWASKNAFVSDFYNDLFNWIVANKNNLSCVTESNGVYTIKVNDTEYGSASFSSPQDIKDTYVYNFERTFATLIYKPTNGTNSDDYVPEIDNNYFLNTEPYRSKYKDCNAYFLNVIKNTSTYSAYSQTYQQASNNRVQIFFRFHQWCNGSNIPTFNNYPNKYIVENIENVDAVMPSDYLTYTINDEFILPQPVSSIDFLGWYLNPDCTGDPVTKIEKGSIGDMMLYAKWNR